MISPDRVILDIDDPDWSAAHGIARDFRSCTKTVAVGPTLVAAHGPPALPSFQELQLKLVVNLCMCTKVPRMLQTIYQFFVTPGVVAVSIMATEDIDGLSTIVDLAKQSIRITHRLHPPVIIARVRSDSKRRRRDIRQQTLACHRAGIYAVIADPEDIPAVRSVAEPPLLVIGIAQRPPKDYRTRVAKDAEAAGIQELLAAGAEHILLSTSMLQRTNAEWVADMASKEVNSWEEEQKKYAPLKFTAE